MKTLHCLALLAAIASRAHAIDYFPPPDAEGGWRMLKTAGEIRGKTGMDLARLEDAYAVAERSSTNGGLLVVRHGYLVFERYFGLASRDANPDMASTGKAFTSIACGVMLQEFRNKIPSGLGTKVFTRKYLPEAFPLDDPRKAEISLGQLLCMSAGYWGEGQTPSGTVMGKVTPLKPVKKQDIRDLDNSSLRVPLWTKPGGGYSYSSPSPHIASIVLRHVTGMELQDYIRERLAKPMGWGAWGYCLHRGDFDMPHANGAGSIALRATDALRFAYCLLHQGKWKDRQLVPADYIRLCHSPSAYNPHTAFSLQFEHNSDGHVPGAPRDAFFKSGAGGFCLYVVPSLDAVIYKLGGKDSQYDPALTGIPQPAQGRARDSRPIVPRAPSTRGGVGGNALWRVLELVSAAAKD